MGSSGSLRWAVLAAVLALDLRAQEATSALLDVVAQAPLLEAARRRVEAARSREESAGRLPDPEVEGMGMRRRIPMGDDMTMWEFNLRQPLPRRGERAADRARAEAAAAMAEAEYAAMAGELAADTAMLLSEIAAAQARQALLQEQRQRLQAVLRAIETRISTGGDTRLADRLTIETRLASLELAVAEQERMIADAQADARGRLGLPDDARLASYAAPDPAEIAVDASAPVHQAAARRAEAEAMAGMARASARPMTALGLRLERAEGSMGNEDTVGLAFMTELPFRSRRYARADLRAAQAERAAAVAERTGATFRIASVLTRVERADRLAALARRLAGETRARIEAEVDALLRRAAAGTGGGSTVLQIVELLDEATETDLQIVEAEAGARAARAELWRYAPVVRFVPAVASGGQTPLAEE